MKICVVGNSHAAALKTALDNAPAGKFPILDFLVFPGVSNPEIVVVNGRIHPARKTSKNVTTVPGALEHGLALSEYDLILLSACGYRGAQTEFLEKDPEGHPLGFAYCADWMPPDSAGEGAMLLSRSAFRETVATYARSHPSVEAAFLLAKHYKGPILVQPWPAPSRALKQDESWTINTRFGENAPKAWLAFMQAHRCALQAFMAELGARFTLLEYPLPEVAVDGFMDKAWCHDPNSRYPSEHWHGNARYGALVLEQVAALLR